MRRFGVGTAVGFVLGAVTAALAITPAQIFDGDSRTEPKYLWGWAVYTIHGDFVCAEPEVGRLRLYCNTTLKP